MGHKYLQDFLKEDQEPFHLKTFIADHRRSHLKPTTTTITTVAGATGTTGKTSLNNEKQNPIIHTTTSRNFCINHVCLFSFQDSPDFTKSPFLDFPARDIKLKTPCNSNNATVFLQKPKPELRQIGFGLLGSFLRRFKDRSMRTKNREITEHEPEFNVTVRRKKKVNDNGCNDSIVSSSIWSEKSSEKLSEMETSCSSRSVNEFEKIECLCSNPSSPFRFSLQKSPLPSRRSPTRWRSEISSSVVVSPSCCFKQDGESYEPECSQDINRQKEEEKEQSSPVSVLDTLFDDGDEELCEDGDREENYDMEYNYANVQRAKHELLQKLQRFERLAGLDPIKLENHLLEQCYDNDEDVLVNGGEVTDEELFKEIINHLDVGKIPWYMKKLIFDLVEEENKNEELDLIVQRVCKRLHSWKVVELNTIDMMVETDFRNEGWNRCDQETITYIEMDIEVAIFGFLLEELTHELVMRV